MALVVGLTGGLGAGKSTAAAMLAECGAKIFDADAVVHRAMRRDGACFKPILAEFGGEILTRGAIDRRKLAGIVFFDKRKLRRLERIVHPVVRAKMSESLSRLTRSRRREVYILEVPLLFETRLHQKVDAVVVVTADRRQQIERAQKRLEITRNEAWQRLKLQMPLEEKAKRADFIIDNRGTLKKTQQQVRKIWQELQQKMNSKMKTQKTNQYKEKNPWRSPRS